MKLYRSASSVSIYSLLLTCDEKKKISLKMAKINTDRINQGNKKPYKKELKS